MRLLVTRPEPDAGETADRLRALGHTVLVDPMLTTVFAEPSTKRLSPGAILLTSRNALRALLRWPQAEAWRSLPVFAVGAETAALAREAGFADVRSASGHVAALIRLVAEGIEAIGGPLLYPAAHDRAGDLENALALRNVSVTLVEAYRAEAATSLAPQTIDALRHDALDGVLFYSQRTSEAFAVAAARSGVEREVARLTCYAISPQAAGPLRAIAGARIEIAARPDSESLLALIPRVTSA
jgi:uroporphyrinogen-III synthase